MGIGQKRLTQIDSLIRLLIGLTLVVFVLYPFFSVFSKALLKDGHGTWSAFSFLKNEKHLIQNSLTSGLLSASLSTLFALALSLMSFFITPTQRKALMFILLLSLVSPPFIGSLTYIELFGRNGLITKQILGLSLNPYGLWGIVSVQTLGFTSAAATLLIGYLDTFDRTMIEAAKSLRATTTSIVLEIILPLMKPALAVSFLLSLIRSMADFTSPMIIGGAYNTLATEAYFSIIAKGNAPRASALSLILFGPSLVVFILYHRYAKQPRKDAKLARTTETRMKKSGLYYGISALSLFFLSWLIIQYTAVFTSAFTDKFQGTTYFTLQNITDSLPHIRDSFVRSILYALITGIASSALGFLMAYYSILRGHTSMKVLDFLANMPYIVPGTFFGLGYIFAFNKPPLKLTGTAAIVLLNLIFRQLPVSVRTLETSLVQIDRATLNSARDLGAHPLFALKDVVFPLSFSGLFLSFTNAFIASMTTIGSIIFLVYPNRKLATLVLFDLVASGKYKVAAVLSCLIILICLAMSLLSYQLYHRRSHVLRR